VQVSAPRTPLCAISMIFCATTLVAGSSIIFKLSALQTLSSAPDISVIVSGSNAFPVFYWFYFSSRMHTRSRFSFPPKAVGPNVHLAAPVGPS
jgi:hypothetical protein